MKLSAQQKRLFNEMAALKQDISKEESLIRKKRKRFNELFELGKPIAIASNDTIVTNRFAMTFKKFETNGYEVAAKTRYGVDKVVNL
tara:strand:+ start:221 stop:481 length:261 start_codon:yes stop_codon:yes gene_type:complete